MNAIPVPGRKFTPYLVVASCHSVSNHVMHTSGLFCRHCFFQLRSIGCRRSHFRLQNHPGSKLRHRPYLWFHNPRVIQFEDECSFAAPQTLKSHSSSVPLSSFLRRWHPWQTTAMPQRGRKKVLFSWLRLFSEPVRLANVKARHGAKRNCLRRLVQHFTSMSCKVLYRHP
jgi:hypothetical protein